MKRIMIYAAVIAVIIPAFFSQNIICAEPSKNIYLLEAPADVHSPTKIVLLDHSGLSWQEARIIIESHGGELLHILPPNALIGSIPDSAIEALTSPQKDNKIKWISGAIVVVENSAQAQDILSREQATLNPLSEESVAALSYLLPRIPVPVEKDGMHRVNPDGSVDVLPPSEWEFPPLLPEDGKLFGVGNTWYNTSDFRAGDVAIGIIRPESNGTDGSNTETWTAQEVTDTLTRLMDGMTKVANQAPCGKMTFIYRTESYGGGVTGTVDSNYECINYANHNDTLVLHLLGNIGYTNANAWERRHEWVNDLRTDLGTDWAVGFFIVDDSAAGGTGRASAYLNGPAVWIFSHNTSSVYMHESGHSWGAWDEYHPDAAQSPTKFGGYSQEVNANSQYNDATGYFSGAGEGISATMINNIDYASPWSLGQWGVWDLDGDGRYEPEDTFPEVTLNAPSGSNPLTFTGTASVFALRMETGSNASTNISISKILLVEWRMNGGPWQDATPSDGSFNSSTENFTFTTPALRNGGILVETRARDNFGNTTQLFTRRDASVSGSAAVNTPPIAALAVSPSAGSTSTSFQFSGTGSLDPEEGAAGLEYRWDYENDSVWDTSWSSSAAATRSYASAGSKTCKMEVRDRQGLSVVRTVSFTVSSSNIAPNATFIVDKGMIFAPTGSPVTFNFDASGVWDGETDPASLQVRWDWENDGTWDTGYSTTKTASHDYAQGYAVNPSQEAYSTWLYSGCSVNGYAQSFVAQTTSIGKAELNLDFNAACATPGGTITVGIRSATTGAWLTSVTRNQADLTAGTWNIFDFSDIAVTNGNTYYLVALTSDKDLYWLASSANPYAGGSHYYSTNGGASWTNNATYDHVFRIYDGSISTVLLTKSKVWRVKMEVLDGNGNTAQTVRDVIGNGYDSAPTVSAFTATPSSGTTATNFSFSATGSDPDTASWDNFLNYRFDVEGDGNYDAEFGSSAATTKTYSRSGIYTVFVEARDRYHATYSKTVSVNVAPALTTVLLSDRSTGDTVTTDERETAVTLTTTGMPQEMLLSESPSFTGAVWQAFRSPATFVLSTGSGAKTVYAKTRSGAGNESGSVSDGITYTPVPITSFILYVAKNASNAQLTWTSAGAAEYSVYYSNDPKYLSYAQFQASPLAELTLDHSGVLADSLNWYYVVETDPLP
jgi:hypothetical protein